MRPAPGHGARAVGKKAKKKPEATSAGEAPVPDPGEGATLAQPEGAPGPAEGAAGPPALSAAPLPLDGLPAPDLGAFFELRSEEHTSELQSQSNLVCRLLLEKKKNKTCRGRVPFCVSLVPS